MYDGKPINRRINRLKEIDVVLCFIEGSIFLIVGLIT
jgi:hypothetical protein